MLNYLVVDQVLDLQDAEMLPLMVTNSRGNTLTIKKTGQELLVTGTPVANGVIYSLSDTFFPTWSGRTL
jgi:hypothetical protein